MTGWDYGNARVAVLRSRLLEAAVLGRLGEAESEAALVSQLGAFEDWRPFVTRIPAASGGSGVPGPSPEAGPHRDRGTYGAPGTDPDEAASRDAGGRGGQDLAPRFGPVLDGVIEQHRSARLSALLRWYDPPARRLVEAVVMPLDLERVLSILRRRRSGVSADAAPGTGSPVHGPVLPRPVPGALLDADCLARIRRATGEGGPFRELARLGIIGRRDAAVLAGAAERASPPAELEASFHDAWERARDARTTGADDDGTLVRAALRRERRDRVAVRDALHALGTDEAARLEQNLAVERMARLERRARREPLGVAPVVGYCAAVEHQALQLRAVSARFAGARDPGRGPAPAAGR